MKARITDSAALRAVSPRALKAYVIGEGWKPIEPYGEHSLVYAKKESGREIVVPGTAALGDYASIVSDLLVIFSAEEGRDELEVYRDLVSADSDVIRIRSPEAESDGSVRVEAGVDLVVHARDLVLSAACAAWRPRPVYRAGRVREAEDYMCRVRLGQTEQGSFVVTLLAPVPPALSVQTSLWPDEEQEPYERLVTRKLAMGLDAAAHAIEKQNLGADMSIFRDAVSDGVSANLCDAAAELSDHGDGVEISITWARTRPTPHARWKRRFSRAEGNVLREVARVFHEQSARPDEQIIGFITKLARDQTEFDGRVTIKALIDGKLKSVQAELGAKDYRTAITAHEKQRFIQATGTLEKCGQRWRLLDPEDMRIVEDDDAS